LSRVRFSAYCVRVFGILNGGNSTLLAG
jgi:hypothetical protein